jgi:hypothetical protein
MEKLTFIGRIIPVQLSLLLINYARLDAWQERYDIHEIGGEGRLRGCSTTPHPFPTQIHG